MICLSRGVAGQEYVPDLLAVSVDGKWGFIDQAGSLVIAPQFDYADDFRDGLGLVIVQGKYAFVSATGAPVILPKVGPPAPWLLNKDRPFTGNTTPFGAVFSFQAGVARIVVQNTLPPMNGNGAGPGWGPNGKFGLIKKDGSLVILPSMNFIGSFVNGWAFYVAQNESGFLRATGERHPIGKKSVYGAFGAHHPAFSAGYATVVDPVAQRITVYDEALQPIVTLSGLDAGSMGAGLLPVQNREGLWGYANTRGKMLIPYSFASVSNFVEGLAVVKLGREAKYINAKGESAFPSSFQDADPFEGQTAVAVQNNKFGLIDSSGKALTHFSYDGLGRTAKGLFIVRLGKSCGLIDSKGTVHIPIQHDRCDATEAVIRFASAQRCTLFTPDGRQIWQGELHACRPLQDHDTSQELPTQSGSF